MAVCEDGEDVEMEDGGERRRIMNECGRGSGVMGMVNGMVWTNPSYLFFMP